MSYFRKFAFLAGMLAVATGVFLGSSTALAADSSIYVIDMQRVIAQSIAGKAVRSNIENEAKRTGKKLEQIGKELERERNDVMKQASLLSASALEEKKLKFLEKEKDFKRRVSDQKDSLARMRNRELTKVVQEINKVVDEMAKEENLGFVIERDPRLVLYVSSKLDYTDRVIEKLNKRKLDL